MRRPDICTVVALGNQPDYVYTLRMSMLNDFLGQMRRIHVSGLATDERSYYPALAALFDAVGATLSPRVVAIHDVASRGAGHPDYVLQADTTHDTRAAIEAKPASYVLDDIIASEQVRQYANHYGLCLVTNLREFALVSPGRAGNVVEIMRYSLATSEAEFWNTSPVALNRRHEQGIADFLVTVFTWDAEITRPKDLAEALARYAREALRRLEHQPTDQLAALRLALKEALGLHFTDEQGEHFFRSSLVQTLFYGLFSAWVVFRRNDAGGDEFSWRAAGDYLRLPVMRELFERIAIGNQLEMLDIRKPLEWAEATLRRTQWEAFAASFAHGDAVNYFYEPFLEAYDPTLREQLGVWYTPREIITYQVARVDRLLREELHLPLGLADSRVVVLDPATGTGGYLLEVLRVVDQTLRTSGAEAMRALQLREAATQRVFGFEILPAPFVVAHLQIATLLAEHEASLGQGQRAGVYLTNSLTGWNVEEAKQLVLPEYPALKHEAESAAEVKQRAKILVVLGNPPYRAQAGVAEDEERNLIAPYYVGLKERFDVQARGINDLYVRFFRLAERQIAETTGRGIVSLISNNAWLDSLSLPVMRERMLSEFDSVWLDNLHGNRIISERTPNGNSCETIFAVRGQSAGIKPGTAITTLVRHNVHAPDGARVMYRDVWGMPDDLATWGRAERKRAALVWSAHLPEATLRGMYQPIAPEEARRFVLKPGSIERAYETWPAIDELFIHQYPGFQTGRDPDLVSIDRQPLSDRMRKYFDASLSMVALAADVPVLMQDASRYDAKQTREELLRTSGYRDERIIRVAYRPLDDRWLYWEPTTKLLDEKRSEFYQQVYPGNLYISVSTKGRRSINLPTLTDKFGARHLQDPYSQYFPLYVKPEQQTLFGEDGPQLNVRQEVLDALLQSSGTLAEPVECAAIATALFYHILAVTYSPQYATENEGSLLQDWPRIPIPAARELLEASAALGRTVGDLLRPDVAFAPSDEVRALGVPTRSDGGQFSEEDLRVTVRYGGIGRYEPPITEGQAARPGRIWWNDVGCWNNVPSEVWAFTIGGYPVIKKWLDYRHIERLKRPLHSEEVRYVGEMVQRIATLLALGPALDANYQAIKANTLTLTQAQ